MDFGIRPPEINSGRIYCGPGSEMMMTAAAAWDTLAAGLCEVTAGYESAAGKFAEAAAHYCGWLNAVATLARQTATRAKAAANAYEAALAAMVPPPLIESNRARRVSLACANFLGQNSSEIAAVEADYERMWARDADAMYAYAEAAAGAATLAPFPSPPPATAPPHRGDSVSKSSGSWRVRAAPEVVSAGRSVMSAIPAALQGLSAPPLTTLEAFLLPVTASLSKLSSLSAPSDFAIKNLNAFNKAASLQWLLPDPSHADATIAAALGCGASIGKLRVPRAWAQATVAENPVTTTDTEPPQGPCWTGEPIRLVTRNQPPQQPSKRAPS